MAKNDTERAREREVSLIQGVGEMWQSHTGGLIEECYLFVSQAALGGQNSDHEYNNILCQQLPVPLNLVSYMKKLHPKGVPFLRFFCALGHQNTPYTEQDGSKSIQKLGAFE